MAFEPRYLERQQVNNLDNTSNSGVLPLAFKLTQAIIHSNLQDIPQAVT